MSAYNLKHLFNMFNYKHNKLHRNKRVIFVKNRLSQTTNSAMNCFYDVRSLAHVNRLNNVLIAAIVPDLSILLSSQENQNESTPIIPHTARLVGPCSLFVVIFQFCAIKLPFWVNILCFKNEYIDLTH